MSKTPICQACALNLRGREFTAEAQRKRRRKFFGRREDRKLTAEAQRKRRRKLLGRREDRKFSAKASRKTYNEW
jgi:hypothetical protein